MNFQSIKRHLVGTRLGSTLARQRTAAGLRASVSDNPEQGGTHCQAAIAQRLLPGLCSPDRAFLDVGAHIGSVIANVRGAQPAIDVIAIEAVPEKAEHLRRRLPNAHVHACAVGAESGEVSFFVDTVRPGYSSVDPRNNEGLREIVVPMKTLDELVTPPTVVGVVKIDVEGGELSALRGAAELIGRDRPAVQFESGPPRPADDTSQLIELYRWFADRDYGVYVPNRVAHNGPALSEEGFVEGHYYPFRTLDYFAVPSERRLEFRDRARLTLGIKP